MQTTNFVRPSSDSPRWTVLDRARSIAGIIEADADTVERRTEITSAIHQAFTETRLIWLPLPEEYGGHDADIATCIEAVEEIARADGSTGWTFFCNIANFSALFPFLSVDTLTVLYAGQNPPVFAGQLNPGGRSEKIADGYRFAGCHNFASGSAFADWMCAAEFEYVDDVLVLKPDGTPQINIALLRRSEVEFKGNWDAMGLAGTASYDYEVHSQLLPAVRVVDGSVLSPTAEPLRGNAMLRMGGLVTAYALHTACALGIAKRALQEIAKLASTKTRFGYAAKIADDPVFRTAFSHADIEYRAARRQLIGAFRDAEARVAAGGRLTMDDHAILRQNATWAHGKAVEIVSTCFRWAGTTPVRNPSVLGRCMRDVLVTNAHMLFDPKTMTDAGPVLISDWLNLAR